MTPSTKQRRAIEEAVGEFGLACERAARLHREEADALTRWCESRSDIAEALMEGKVDTATILRHYADANALARAEAARVDAVALAKRGHGDIIAACLLLAEVE
jgi:hypothetical protein